VRSTLYWLEKAVSPKIYTRALGQHLSLLAGQTDPLNTVATASN